jgi:hypothetical protein
MLIVAQPGQEILIVAEDGPGLGASGWGDSSRGTPSPKPDSV